MIDTWNPAKLNEKILGRDSWNPAILNEAVTDRDSWNPAILNESSGDTPVEFEATITASFPEGATCTATDGTTTLTADDNPMAFSIPNEGTWAVSCIANGVTFSDNVVITTNGQTETIDLTPIGDTYTTTDSVPVLIACAGIGDSEITTISGALADVETLTAILESENAIDYLVRSTTFASDVTADSVAMAGIGAINYDANTLLADSTWLAAICNSTYFESVLNVKVPTMTSDNTPSGECIGTTAQDSNTLKYKAFDGDNSTRYAPNTTNMPCYLGYKFTQAVRIYKMGVGYDANGRIKNVVLQYSDDNETFVDSNISGQHPNDASYVDFIGINNSEHIYWRTSFVDSWATGSKVTVGTLQFYGRVDV